MRKQAPQDSVKSDPENVVTLGADPEFFIGEGSIERLSVDPIPICGLLGGTKDEPSPLVPGRASYKGYMVQEDNVAAEFNIPATKDAGSFGRAIDFALELTMERIHAKNPKAQKLNACQVFFSDQKLESAQARMFGCDPDFDAYSGGNQSPPIDRKALLSQKGGELRFAGGHMHVGWTNKPPIPEHVMTSFFDAYAYLPYLMYDKQGARRKAYGQAGRFRPKSYGVEYRTPSNFWLHNTTFREGFAMNMFSTAYSLALLEEGYLQKVYNTVPWADVCYAINNEDTARAKAVYQFIVNDLPIGVS